MKRCLSCNINVGGETGQCPICQNALMGEATPNNWPSITKLKLQSFFYKLQLFIVLALIAVSVALDFLQDLNTGRHWSAPVLLWGITLELLIRHFIKKSVVPAAIVTESILHFCMLMLITTGYMRFYFTPIVSLLIPICICGMLIANLVLALVDKKGNAMVYLLVTILMCAVSYIYLYLRKLYISLPWTICVTLAVVTTIGISVFRGRAVLNELQKRMNI